MTEEEAKTKACCGPWLNADDVGNCIASACMAWRWNPTADQVRAVREAFETHMQDAVRLARNEQRPAVHGYCGLAGSPS